MIQLVACVTSPDALLYPHGTLELEWQSPVRYGKGSGGRTEAVVAQIDREGALTCNNDVNSARGAT